MDKNIENMKRCRKFESCSVNLCPLDSEVNLRTELEGEKKCPFTIKKRTKEYRGMKLLLSDYALEVIPRLTAQMLNKGNLRRWCDLHKQ